MNPTKPPVDPRSVDYDCEKVDEAVLALLYLTSFQEHAFRDLGIIQTWKGHDWNALNRLHQKGLISDPVGKAKSVSLTKEGAQLSKDFFYKLFGKVE